MNKIFKTLSLFLPFSLLLTLLLPFFIFSPLVQASLPDRFFKETVASGFNQPVDLAQTPDGRIFVIEKGGVVKVVQNGAVRSQPFTTLTVSRNGERGLLGIALDPSFSTNRFVYLFYVNENPLEYRITRYKENNNRGTNPTTIFTSPINPNSTTHFGGGLRFGKDSKLWFTIGDNAVSANAQDLSNRFGKLLRINSDGTIPSDNPFVNQANKMAEIWSYGLRNPWRFSFRSDGQPIIGDVGGDRVEEVNIGVKGGNFGWPICEGACSNPGMINPIFSYPHNPTQSASITGGFIYNGQQFPAEFRNNYFYGDFVRGYIHRLVLDSQNNITSDLDFESEAGTVVSMLEGNDGSIYFVTIFPGALYRIHFSNKNQPPVAKVSAKPTFGTIPLKVAFSSQGSSDPDGDNLTYEWEFGDGKKSREPNPKHVYKKKGKFTATLVVSDGKLKSKPEIVQIFAGDLPPNINLIEPSASDKYNAGQVIKFSATAIDQEDGEISERNFSWLITFHHRENPNEPDHVHPFLGPLDGVRSGQFTVPDNVERSPFAWFEIKVTVRDKLGLTATVSRKILPNTVNMTINSSPVPNLVVNIDGVPFATNYTSGAIVNYKITVEAVTPISRDGVDYDFVSWSDGGVRLHTITVPNTDFSLTANYKRRQTSLPHAKQYSVVAGDIKINGIVLYDNDSKTGLVTLFEAESDYEAPFGASQVDNPDLQTAESTMARIASEMKISGCDGGCTIVTTLHWPSQPVQSQVVRNQSSPSPQATPSSTPASLPSPQPSSSPSPSPSPTPSNSPSPNPSLLPTSSTADEVRQS